ncbi:MAG TPA: Fur family transcriptional regulator [Dehalococcoidia bacterium]|nr:Fur family transcriptional regulator [Dehalococcoidia bacterium]
MVSVEILERRLTRSGHRLTRPRRSLFAAMQQLDDHFTAEGVVAAAPGVGRATVFRTLRLLQDIGALCQVVLDDGTLEYRLTSGGHHHHIVCSECGSVTDFEPCDIQDLLSELSERTGYDIASHRLEVYGRCGVCRAAFPATAEGQLSTPTTHQSAP